MNYEHVSGDCLFVKGDYKEAMEAYATQQIPDSLHAARCIRHLTCSAACFQLGRYEESLQHAQKAMWEERRHRGCYFFESCQALDHELSHLWTGLSLYMLNQPIRARVCITQALEVAKRGGRRDDVHVYKSFLAKSCSSPQPQDASHTMDDLPDEIVAKIMEYANVPSRFMFASCSKKCYRIVLQDTNDIWPLCKDQRFSPSSSERVYVSSACEYDVVVWSFPFPYLQLWGERFRRENRLLCRFIDTLAQNYDSMPSDAIVDRFLVKISTYFGRFVFKSCQSYFLEDDTQYDFKYLLTRHEALEELCQYLRLYYSKTDRKRKILARLMHSVNHADPDCIKRTKQHPQPQFQWKENYRVQRMQSKIRGFARKR